MIRRAPPKPLFWVPGLGCKLRAILVIVGVFKHGLWPGPEGPLEHRVLTKASESTCSEPLYPKARIVITLNPKPCYGDLCLLVPRVFVPTGLRDSAPVGGVFLSEERLLGNKEDRLQGKAQSLGFRV